MLTALALTLLLPGASSPAADTSAATAPAPAIRLWMSGDRRYRQGERARVQVETGVEGHLLVVHFDTDGRLRILFPLEPGDDGSVHAGRRYEVRGEGDADREAFRATGAGEGLVFGAISPDPFRLEEYTQGGSWDYTRFRIDYDSRDAEAEIAELLQQMTGTGGFDYDVVGYRVYGEREIVAGYGGGGYGGPYLGPHYFDDYWCDPWSHGWSGYFGCRPHVVGWSIRFGLGNPWFYDPWYWRYRYRYAYSPYSPFYPYRPYWPHSPVRPFDPNYRVPVIVGRPRGYDVVRRPLGGGVPTRGTVTGPVVVGTRGPILDGRPRQLAGGRARPAVDRSGDRGRAQPVTNGGSNPPTARAPARRARPDDGDRGSRPTVGSSSGSRPSSGAPERSRGRSRPDGEGASSWETTARPAAKPRNDAPQNDAPQNAPPRARRAEPRRDFSPPPARAEPRQESSPPTRARGGAGSEPRREYSPPSRAEPRRDYSPPPRAEPRSAPRSEPRAASPSPQRGGGSSSPPARSRGGRPRGG